MFKGIFCCMILGWSLGGGWCLDICNDQVEGARLAHPADCSRFIICRQGVTAQIRYCPFGLHFNRFDAICDLQYRAGCAVRYGRQLLDYEVANRLDCDACNALCSAGKRPGGKPQLPPGIKPEQPPCNKPERPPTTPCPTPPTPKPTTPCRPTIPTPEVPTTTPCNPPRPTTPAPTTPCRPPRPPTPPTPPGINPEQPPCNKPERPPTTPCPTPPTPKPTTPCRPTIPTPEVPTTTPCHPPRPTTSPPTTPCHSPRPTTPPPCGPPTQNPDPDPEEPQTSPSGITCADRGKCEGQRDGALFSDNLSTGYIVCQCQCEIRMPCPPNLIFNQAKQSCDWPQD